MFKVFKVFALLAGFGAFAALPSFAAASAVPGTLNYVEGRVTVAGQPVTAQSVGSVQLEPNQVIATAQGRAEILLTPGVFLRIGDHSSVRMASSSLDNIRVDLLGGQAIAEADQVFKDSNIRVTLDGTAVKLTKHGLYSFNADSGQIRVLDGKATVERDDRQVDLKKGRQVQLSDATLKPSKFDTKATEQQDPLYAWSRLRSEYDSEASIQSASVVTVGGPGWWGPGWYWNPWWGMYSYLPGDGYFYSPFGWPYYSPIFLYATPGFRYGYGYGRPYYGHAVAGRGFAGPGFRGGAAPRTGGGFAGHAGFAGGSGFHGGGFARGDGHR